jgi:tetratricopeptide (TPR) repeat protein
LFGDAAPPTGADAAAPVDVDDGRRSLLPPTYYDADRLVDDGKFEQALTIYQRASRSSPGDRLARAGVELVEGLRAIAKRDRLEAAQRFEAALELDPANERAARELAEMRRIATTERKGLLSRLLGKKE